MGKVNDLIEQHDKGSFIKVNFNGKKKGGDVVYVEFSQVSDMDILKACIALVGSLSERVGQAYPETLRDVAIAMMCNELKEDKDD